MSDATVEFGVLCAMFEALIRNKKLAVKRKHLRTFLEHVYTGREHFSAMRLILPDLDKERANYGMKEAQLAKFLGEALGLSTESEDAKKLVNWRKGGQRSGSNAGNFSIVAAEVLYRRQKTAPGGLKIRDVNDLLDRLAGAEDKDKKTGVLAEFISKTNAQEMRWVLMIILKDLKLGMSEKTVFSEFHPDAEDYFNVTCDLKLVCEKLSDRNIRYTRQDIEVGKAVRPQLAARAANVDDAWKKMRGKEVLVECKFDGDRIQVHKNGNNLNFWSRSFTDHPEYLKAIGDVLRQHIIPEKCILDGELLVWDRVANRFAEFGSNRGVAKEAEDGLDSGQQMCYVAFDILYAGDGSVIHMPLRERHRILQNSVRALSGRLELLIPEAEGLNSKRAAGEPCWSTLAKSAEDVKRFFQETIDNREEGIVLKDFDSKWEPSNRDNKWLKLKPDYIQAESDLDVLIIGGYYGSGRRGGEVAQFLLGLAERPRLGGHPTKFYSFCKVGTGLSDDEAAVLVHKLRPYFRRNEKGSPPPAFYVVTNAAKERPDVWIDQPEKSVILQITSDIRTIRSEVFASPYSLRFPRVEKIRYDKPWYDCLDVQSLVDAVQAKSGEGGGGGRQAGDGGTPGKAQSKVAKVEKMEPKRSTLVPSHMLLTDVSRVKQTTHLFKDLVFHFANTSSEYPVGKLHQLAVENGGAFSMNLSSIVTHTVAFEKKGLKYQAASKNGDVLNLSWFLGCMSHKALLPVGPKYYLHMSAATKELLKSEVDEFGDFYFMDIDESDLKEVFGNLSASMEEHDVEKVKHYTKKYCPTLTWCHYSGCCVYFLRPLHSTNEDTLKVATVTLKRLALEVEMHEGTVSEQLTRKVTHVVAYSSLESSVAFHTILQSVSPEERRRLLSKRVRVVSHHWIEDSVGSNSCGQPEELKYDLRSGEVLESEEDEEEEVAIPPISKTLSASIVPITPDKKVAPRPPRKPIARKRALPLGGRGRGRRGLEREESPPGDTLESDEEELDREGDTRVKKLKGNLTVGDGSGVESSRLVEPVEASRKPVLRRTGRSRKKDDYHVPKRRLVLDEGEVSALQDSDSAPPAMEPPRTRATTRAARKRKVPQRVDEGEKETAAAISNPEGSHLEGSRPEGSHPLDEYQAKSYDVGHSPALEAMIGTLLPGYLTSQLPSFDSAEGGGLPSRSNSLRVDSLDSDIRPETRRPDPPVASATADPFDRSKDYLSGTAARGTSSREGEEATEPPPGGKPKVSYKDLVSEMLYHK